MNKEKIKKSIECYSFLCSFQRFNEEFRNNRQHDSGEFLLFLIEELEKEGEKGLKEGVEGM